MDKKELLSRFSDELFDLISDEDLTDDKLREAAEGLLPALCDSLYDNGFGKRIEEDKKEWDVNKTN